MNDKTSKSSAITNCFIKIRQGDPPLFVFDGRGDGMCRVYLDGYALVPLEDYHALLLKSAPLWNRLAIRFGFWRARVGEVL